MKPLWLAAAAMVWMSFSAPAQNAKVEPKERPALKTLVRQSDLIVLCRYEIKNGIGKRRVVETWKGEYRPELFESPPAPGYLYRDFDPRRSPVVAPHEGREVIYFFRRADPEGKLVRHSDWFVVV